MEKSKEPLDQADPDFFYREAIMELGRLNDRRFARVVNSADALGVLTFALLYFLTHWITSPKNCK